MTYSLHPGTERDVADALDFYNEHAGPAVAARFLEEFERIAKIDLAILRLAMFEMIFRKDIPPVVSINEAIDLSKQFSNADAKRFINGILDRLKDQLGRDARRATAE